MKNYLIYITIVLIGLLIGKSASAQGLMNKPVMLDTITISTTQTVHIRFNTDLTYVDLGSRTIIAKIVEGSKNLIAVKARESFDYRTSISCLESNGVMHTFIVKYNESPSKLFIDNTAKQYTENVLNTTAIVDSTEYQPQTYTDCDITTQESSLEKILKMPKEIYHIGAKNYGISIMCDNILVNNDILYIVLTINNQSAVSYTLSTPRFAIESTKRTKRSLQYEKAVYPLEIYGVGTTTPSASSKMVFSFDKLTLIKRQAFCIYLYEYDGSRNFTITIRDEFRRGKGSNSR